MRVSSGTAAVVVVGPQILATASLAGATPPESGCPSSNQVLVVADLLAMGYRAPAVVDGVDTMVQITIQAGLKATVVLDSPIVRLTERNAVFGGVVGTYGAGGADLTPRHFRVVLDMFDPPTVEYRNEDYQVVASPAFTLAGGDVERFHVWAYAMGRDLVQWTLELPVIINGKRRTIPVLGTTDVSFRTLGHESGLEEMLSYGQGWQSRDGT
jgi:hypothetical protein